MGEMKNAYSVLSEQLEATQNFGDLIVYVRIILKWILKEEADWINLANRFQLRVFVHMVMGTWYHGRTG
jgi:hypothetical protein